MLNYQRDLLPYLSATAGNVLAENEVPACPLTLQHQYYAKAKTHKADILATFGDVYPPYLDINRPRERADNKQYRKDIYRNPMRGFAYRVANALDYIQQADDFEITYPPIVINTEDRLQDYTGQNFSVEGSALNWFFTLAVPAYVADPNAVLLVLPSPDGIENDYFGSQTVYPSPQFSLIPSENVWQWQRGKKAVLVGPERCLMIDAQGKETETGLVLYFCDHESYAIARQVGRTFAENGYKQISHWQVTGYLPVYNEESGEPAGYTFTPLRHFSRGLPAIRLGKKRVEKNARGEEFYESIVADAMPFVKDAQQDKNDIQVEKNFHIGSQEWRKASKKCKNQGCIDGQVSIQGVMGAPYSKITCPVCKGNGVDASGSGAEIIYVSDGMDSGGSQVPGGNTKSSSGAPGGYIPRPIEALKEFRLELDCNVRDAFKTVNMQFIEETPQEVSGASKRYDREEMYRELNTQAAHLLLNVLREAIICLDNIRYGPSGKNGRQVPSLLVPVRYNLENAELTRTELNDALLNKYDPTIIEALQLKVLAYTSGTDSEVYKRYVLRTKLDTFKDQDDQVKLYFLATNFTLMQQTDESRRAVERIYLSLNFDGLVSEVFIEHPDFWEMDIKKQRDLLYEANRSLVGTLNPNAVQIGADGMPVLNSVQIKPAANLQQLNQTRNFSNKPGQGGQ